VAEQLASKFRYHHRRNQPAMQSAEAPLELFYSYFFPQEVTKAYLRTVTYSIVATLIHANREIVVEQ
jgi:hypothetical protein